jgi:aromatic ring-opening dioxygenase catalytic subunit (LigB family)
MPAAFLAHGSPMNALERNRYTDAWRAIGAAVPRPRAILMVSTPSQLGLGLRHLGSSATAR